MSSLENLKPIALGVAELTERIKELQAKKKELEEELRPALEGHGPVQFDEYIVECKVQPGRKTLDKSAVEEAFGDLSDFYKTGKPFTVLSVKKVTQA